MSRLFLPGGQSTGASASESVLPIKYSGLISFRIDWVALLVVQGTPKSLRVLGAGGGEIICLTRQFHFGKMKKF